VNPSLRLACRLVGALAVLLGGSVHLQQWLTVFRDLDVGPLFLVNVGASVVVGALLLAGESRLVAGAGIAVSAGRRGSSASRRRATTWPRSKRSWSKSWPWSR
jgi:hypothetical protein